LKKITFLITALIISTNVFAMADLRMDHSLEKCHMHSKNQDDKKSHYKKEKNENVLTGKSFSQLEIRIDRYEAEIND